MTRTIKGYGLLLTGALLMAPVLATPRPSLLWIPGCCLAIWGAALVWCSE